MQLYHMSIIVYFRNISEIILVTYSFMHLFIQQILIDHPVIAHKSTGPW